MANDVPAWAGRANVSQPSAGDRRIVGLDGLRGFAGLTVVLSHFFGEVPHAVRAAALGWVAVDIFFVLSGFLIGRLILEKRESANFFKVFYVRRAVRLMPPYFITLTIVMLLIAYLPAAWTDAGEAIPPLAYYGFLQNFWMVGQNGIGAHWLAPTWTLAVEEHFYLIAPAAIVFLPKRTLLPVLSLTVAMAVGFRCWALATGSPHLVMASLALLPGRADLLAIGIITAIIATTKPSWSTRSVAILRIAPIACLIVAGLLVSVDMTLFQIIGPTFMGAGCATMILGILIGTPEGIRFNARSLRWIGDNSYCLYLIHLPVLGLMHGLILGTTPDIGTPAQLLVTIAALPITFLLARLMTRTIEEPFMAYGRRWRWGADTVASLPNAAVATA